MELVLEKWQVSPAPDIEEMRENDRVRSRKRDAGGCIIGLQINKIRLKKRLTDTSKVP